MPCDLVCQDPANGEETAAKRKILRAKRIVISKAVQTIAFSPIDVDTLCSALARIALVSINLAQVHSMKLWASLTVRGRYPSGKWAGP